MSDTFRCGHPKSGDNLKVSPSNPRGRCRACFNKIIQRRNTGEPKGRPRNDYFNGKPIGITQEDLSYRDMVRMGTERLGAAIERLLRRGAA
jgi:hypothetical protein